MAIEIIVRVNRKPEATAEDCQRGLEYVDRKIEETMALAEAAVKDGVITRASADERAESLLGVRQPLANICKALNAPKTRSGSPFLNH